MLCKPILCTHVGEKSSHDVVYRHIKLELLKYLQK